MNRHTTFEDVPLLQRDSCDDNQRQHDDDDYNGYKEEFPCKRNITSLIWKYNIVQFVTRTN